MISTKIKDLRIKNDITQEQLSKELSVAKSTIGMWENGRREPDIDMIKKIAITVTIYDAEDRNQNFGQVENAYVHLIDNSTKREILRYDLTDNYFGETALVVAEFIKSKNNVWTFKAVGQGFNNGLEGLCNRYGIDVK